ncbi:hypothetical protein BXY66_1190 [Shimia isoporae]|uniref:Uncharacterized protein n=1 Tax=Shimia isoporae TaxID=647720 RepID=A0A4R1NLB4_9RHOB|nr:hypothetical protein [Shimia isoporae]TCL09146.1 hypothetical protein BXY66_1190 [Shimia isoporae]
MEGQALKDGKDRVRDLLIKPLLELGMVRKRNVSESKHQAFLDGPMARLAYMKADRLEALRETVANCATGAHKNCWSSEVSIANWARAL